MTDPKQYAMDPAWSPDGRRIVFAVGFEAFEAKDIWIMDADGRNPRPVTSNPDYEVGPTWSSDGMRLVFASMQSFQTQFDLYMVNVDGSERRNLTNTPNLSETEPAWSPNGKTIAFVSSNVNLALSGNIFLMDADGSNIRPLTNDVNRYNMDPAWSPDGKRIAFASQRDGGSVAIYVMDADGSNALRLTSKEPPVDYQPTWSPDGTEIAFVSYPDNFSDIHIMRANGTAIRRITEKGQMNIKPDWFDPYHPRPVEPVGKLPTVWAQLRRSMSAE